MRLSEIIFGIVIILLFALNIYCAYKSIDDPY